MVLPPKISDLLSSSVVRLRTAGIESPAVDARVLLAHALKVSPDRLLLHLGETAGEDLALRYEPLIARRCAREPVSHIIGARLFWGRSFYVSSDVLDPRPETEILVAEALSAPFTRVLDLGTGSGAILLTLLAERPGAIGQGVDVSQSAVVVAKRNAQELGVAPRADLRLGSWFSSVEGRFDLIVANPPYISAKDFAALSPEVRVYEPRHALTDGGDGLSAYREILANVRDYLTPQGRLLFEIGPSQSEDVKRMCHAAGFLSVRIMTDLDRRPRVVDAAGIPD